MNGNNQGHIYFFMIFCLFSLNTQTRPRRDKKQTRRQSMAEMVFSSGMSELRCIIFTENNDYPYKNYNNYIKLSIVFHPMIIFLGNKDI